MCIMSFLFVSWCFLLIHRVHCFQKRPDIFTKLFSKNLICRSPNKFSQFYAFNTFMTVLHGIFFSVPLSRAVMQTEPQRTRSGPNSPKLGRFWNFPCASVCQLKCPCCAILKPLLLFPWTGDLVVASSTALHWELLLLHL